MKVFKKIYLYIAIFGMLYIEYGYRMVVSDTVSGTVRTAVLALLAVPFIFMIRSIHIKSIALFGYLVALIGINLLANPQSLSNYILLILPIFIGFVVSEGVKFDELIDIFCNIMIFVSVFSLAMYAVAIVAPGLINMLPSLGYFPDSAKLVRDAFFSVTISNPEVLRNFGFAWEPGAYAILLCIALFGETVIKEKFSLLRTCILVITIATTFSTMGYIVMICIILGMLNQKGAISAKHIVFTLLFITSALLLMYTSSSRIYDVVFSKLEGLFSDSGSSVAVTTQARINAIVYPLKEFLSSPVIGVGYERFAYVNMAYCDSIATNTIINWFAIMGVVFGAPCAVAYIKLVASFKKESFRLLSCVLFILGAVLLVSTESLLRISTIYVIIFYGCRNFVYVSNDSSRGRFRVFKNIRKSKRHGNTR